jgi:hypothetical protein
MGIVTAAPWQVDRRHHRPDVRHTAGLTFDDIQPTEADDAELKRSLRSLDRVYEQMYQLGRTSKRCPTDANVWETAAWWQGRYDRNRRRQEVVWAWLCTASRRVVGRKPKRRKNRRKSRWDIKIKPRQRRR